ncbi:MAG: DUF4868 domain-containing protein [Chloroflexota bacterium]|nr:MAG: DUF4868 domain-containing protein [Chloroflexota bacterium]
MSLEFHLADVSATEFGVGLRGTDVERFVLVAVDQTVQVALRGIVIATWSRLAATADEVETVSSAQTAARYQPSEKYGSSESLYLPLDDSLAESVRDLHNAENLATDSGAMGDPQSIYCYFVRLTDGTGRRLTGVRRATTMKGTLKSQGHLMGLFTDQLRIISEPIFRLDHELDFLIDGANVHILNHVGFEIIGKMREAILAAVPRNIESIQQDLAFVDLSGVQEYAKTHPRAAACIASIRRQGSAKNVDRGALLGICERNGVEIIEANGKIVVSDTHVLGFLEILDRRRYELELVSGEPERFRAASRTKIDSRQLISAPMLEMD